MPRWPAKPKQAEAPAAAGLDDMTESECVAGSEPADQADPEPTPKQVDQAGEGSLTKIPAKQRKFAKGM